MIGNLIKKKKKNVKFNIIKTSYGYKAQATCVFDRRSSYLP